MSVLGHQRYMTLSLIYSLRRTEGDEGHRVLPVERAPWLAEDVDWQDIGAVVGHRHDQVMEGPTVPDLHAIDAVARLVSVTHDDPLL